MGGPRRDPLDWAVCPSHVRHLRTFPPCDVEWLSGTLWKLLINAPGLIWQQ